MKVNIFKIFQKKEKFPIRLFIVVSIFNFLLLILLLVFLSNYLAPSNKNAFSRRQKSPKTKYYFKEDYNPGDDYITPVPKLKDMLAGPIIGSNDPILGAQKALIAVVMYSDFECNFCKKQEKVIKKIINDYQNMVKLIWKDYPEGKISSYSWRAAIAGRCAQQQGKFWEYQDLLFENKGASENKLVQLAQQAGMDEGRFRQCLTNQDIIKLIKDNILEAQALEIYGIPFVYVNNQQIMGEFTYQDLKKIIELEISAFKNGKKK